MDFGNITGQIMDKADWVAGFLAAYSRFNGNLEQVFRNYTTFSENEGVLLNIRSTVDSMDHIMWKLWQSPHLYTSMFKISAMARIFMELFDIIPPKYKKTFEKVMIGSAIAAFTLPGAGGGADHGLGGGSHFGFLSGSRHNPHGAYSEPTKAPYGTNVTRSGPSSPNPYT